MTGLSPPLLEALEAQLQTLRERSLLRTLEPPSGRDFISNDYLGLSQDERVVGALREALLQYGAGSRAARLLGGTLPPHVTLEARAARWLRSEAALFFPSGYHANLGLLSTLAERGDVLVCDGRLHASLIDGARLCRARVVRFVHDDPESLSAVLARHPGARRRLVVTESVESMDGTLAPLQDYARVCVERDAWLLVDEAHAAGLYGSRGEGRAAELERVLARVVTCGKALGVAGALVAASRAVVDLLLNRARSFVFTTAPPPAIAAAVSAAVDVVQAEAWRRDRAHGAAAHLRVALGLATAPQAQCSPIVSLVLGSSERALAVAEHVRGAGFDVRAVRPPTVPEGSARLRLVCRSDHTAADLDGVAQAIHVALAGKPLGPSPPSAGPRATWILGTDTGVGKTVVAALLLRCLARAQGAAAYLKPVQTGSDDDTQTVRALAGSPAHHFATPLLRLALPASVDQAAEAAGVAVRVADLLDGIRRTQAQQPARHWVLEAAGGLLVPLSNQEDQADLVQASGLPALLVARAGLGTLNHTRLTLEALFNRRIELRAIVFVGARHPGNERSLATWAPEVPLLHLPALPELTSAALDAWAGASRLLEALA